MGKDALVEFLNSMADDASLQEEVRNAAEGSGEEAAVSAERLVEIAQARGYEFTAQEAAGVGELSDDDLEAVSGGAVFAKYEWSEGRGDRMLKGEVGMLKGEVGGHVPLKNLFGFAKFI